LLTLSARDGSALRSLAERYDDQLGELKGNADGALRDLTAAAAVRRTAHEHRLTCVGQTPDDLREALRAFVSGQERPGLSAGVRRIGRRPRTVFVFAGQGARWWPLMGDPDRVFGPPGTAVLEQCEDLLRDQAGWSLRDQLTAPTDRSRLAEPEVGQPALCALQLALAATWRTWGVEPQAVVGHSVGEIAAAAVAGALTTADALRVALARGQAIRAAIGRGRMAVTALTADAAQEWIGRCGLAGVAVAAVNGPRSTVLSGPEPELSRLSRELDEAGVFCRLLDAVDFASHGPQMDGPQADLVRRLDGLRAGRASLPMLSTVSGAVVDGEQLDAAYWAANLRNPVLFDVAVSALIGEGYDTFVELSGHPGLAAEVEQRLAAEQAPGAAVSSLRRDLPARATMLGELGRLWCAGYDLDWRRVYGPASRMVTLPTYPWQRTRHWLDDELGHRPAGSTGGHPVLDTHLRSAADPFAAHWTGTVDLRRLPYLRDHQVDTAPVLPAALLLDAALTAARRVTGDEATELETVRLERMTVVDETTAAATLQLVMFPESTGHGAFRIFTRRADDAPDAVRDGGWAAVASGRFAGPAATGAAGTGVASDAGAELDTARSRCPRTQDVEEHYARLAAVGLQYGTAFRAVAALQAGDGEAIGRLHERARLTADRDPYLIHPALLDGCLQVLAATVAGDAATYLPVEVGRFRLTAHGDAVRWVHATIDRPAAGSAGVEPAPDRLTGRLTLHDDGGRRVGELDGIVLQRLQAPAGDPVGDALLELAWTPVGASAAGPGPLDGAGRSAGRRWLLLADRTGLADGLRDRLAGRGEPCATVLPGTQFRRLDATGFAVRPDSPEDLARVLAEVAPDDAASLHVVHAWALDAAPVNGAAEVTAEQTTATYERVCLPVLHLVRALAQRPSQAGTRLSLLTRGAQRTGVEPASAAGPEQTALWGLGRVIGMEHPELHPHLVDLDPRTEPGDLDTLLPELLRTDVPAQLALRDGTRLVPRLVPRRPEAGIGPRNDGQGSVAAQRIPFDPSVHGNHRILAGHPGILDSLAPAPWRRVEPGPGQVEVEVRATGLNFNDVLKALDVCPGVPPGRVPLGAECAGRVVAVGEGVTGLAVGDAVMAVAPSSLAAYATTDARLVSPRPEGLDDQQAAALPIAFLTAVYGLEYLARLRPGETVLIHAATGGVGLAALQVAHRNGARVIATAGSQRKRELLRTLGVDHVMDSRSLAFADQIRELTGGRGVDVVLNSLTGEALRRSLALLAPNGRFVEIGKQDVYADSHLGLSLLQRNRFLFAVDLELCLAEQPDLIAELLGIVHAGFVEGSFTALPVTTFGYAEAGDAFAYMAQARHTGKIVLRPDGRETLPPSAAPVVRGDATYLITGGLGGLGLCSAEHLVEAGARSVVLLGRHAPGPQVQAAVEGLRARGARVVVRTADVARAGDVDAVLAEVDATLPPLAGIVHAAGVLDDALLLHQDADRFRTVAGPKVTGAWNLHRATAGRDLDLFVLYSSAAALLGSPGQANYAAANGFLDGLARYRRARGLPALSIAWGPWSQVGLAARTGSDDALAAVGVNPISPADGTAALSRLLPGGPVDACVLPLDRTRLRMAAELGLLPQLLLGLVDPGSGNGAGPARTVAAKEIRRRLLEVEPGRRREVMLLQHCREEAARVLKLDPARVAPDEPLAGMGIDSLMALELRKRLETSLGITLPATVAWRFPTLQAMTPFLAEQMGIALHGDAESVPVSRAGAGGSGGPEQEQVDLAELEGLSDLDMEALLLAKLADLDEGRGA
jgi:polyketide synthase 12